MKYIETNNIERKIWFKKYNFSTNWIEYFPTSNWCLIILANKKQSKYFNEIIEKVINRNVGYVCAIGKQHDLIHDLFDEELAYRDVYSENNYLPQHHIMTVGIENIEEGIWFGLHCTLNSECEIKEIAIIDLTKDSYKLVFELIQKIDKNYLT